MSIRTWALKDAEAILVLLEELNAALDEDQIVSIPAMQEHYSEMLKYPEIYENYVYEKEGVVLGFLSLINYRSVYHRKGTTLINELIVRKDHRNIGIGEELLNYAIIRSKIQGMDEIEVGVMKENIGAIRFYKRNGIDEEYYILGKEF